MSALSEDLLKVLACPECKGKLDYSRDENTLKCNECGYIFPVKEGIPVMLVEEARKTFD